MPLKLKHIFEKEYGKAKGDRIFYGYEAKHGIHFPRHHSSSKTLVLKGNPRKINYMYHHLLKEHPSTKGHLFIRTGRRM